jgi:hypothetical protein
MAGFFSRVGWGGAVPAIIIGSTTTNTGNIIINIIIGQDASRSIVTKML